MKASLVASGLSAALLLAAFISIEEHKEILLWPNGAPGSEGKTGVEKVRVAETGDHVVSNIHRPSITSYLPVKSSGAAIIIAPGGGHRELWIDHEGDNPAKWLSEKG